MLLFLLLLMAGAGGLGRAQTPAAAPSEAPATPQAEAQPPPLPEGYAGTETCGLCHQDIAQAFRRNPHFAVDNGRSRNVHAKEWASRACEACHGSGKAHAEAGDGKNIFVFKGAAAARVNEQCLACHAGQETHHGRLFGAHNRNQLSCVSCHTVHHATQAKLLASAPNALCEGCHLSVRAEFTRPYRHKLQENAIECVDCHNPHGELPPRSLRRVAANELVCLKCHSDKRGPFPFEHAPVRMNPCSTCHEPHGSVNPRMLVRHDQSLLCLECHTTSLATIGSTPPAFHDLRSARFRNCTICHSKIHGSFVSRELLR
ncbi:MAG TPA: DmsE family decaheme c-type cytochrome [Bryobacterales bacterium]|nr:DmsE family decaheme c-type cytochrome [Bryobacterales bacterium]